jgi:hypothetical protein
MMLNQKSFRNLEDRERRRDEARSRLDLILSKSFKNDSELKETFDLVNYLHFFLQ